MKTIAAALVLTLALPLVPSAADRFDTPPDWRKKPTPQELLAVWPSQALAEGLDGEATIRCKVSLEGALFDCSVLQESPAGKGFGAAAVALTPQFLMKPAMKDGKPVVSEVNVPIAFKGLNGRAPSFPNFGSRKILGNVAWVAAPTAADLAAAFPAKARAAAAPGHVALNCPVKADGGLGGCTVISEEPKGMGFGKAARDLAPRFRAPTQTAAGQSTRGMEVHLAVTFAIEMLGDEPRIGKPQWVALPSAADVEASLTPTSRTVAGRAVLDCRVAAGGHVDDCRLAEETPPGQGLGSSALALSSKFVLSLWTAEGLPTQGGRVLAPVRYTPQ